MAISGGDGSIILDTKVDTKGLNSGLNSMKGAITKIGGLLAAAFSVKLLMNFAKETTNLYKIQMQNEVKLATVMRQRMKATDEQIKQVLNLASAEQQLGIIGDEVQLAGLQQVATFATQKETLEALLPAMNNLIAQQYGYEASVESARNVANMMGKALQGQIGALSRVGITFSEAEANALKMGNEMERASVLAKIITNNVGEMNYALAQTDVGRQQQLANTWGDIKEQFGAAFTQIAIIALPVLNAVAKALAWVANLARMVAQTIANMFGMKSGGGSQKSGIGGLAISTGSAAEGMSNLGNATEKAGKQAKKAIAGFDDLQTLTESVSTSAEKASEEPGGIGSGIGGEVGTGFDFGIQEEVGTIIPLQKALENLHTTLTPLKESLSNLREQLQPLQDFSSQALQDFYNLFLVPVGNWILGEGFPRFVDAISKQLALVDWSELNGALANLWKAVTPFAINVGEGLLWFWENALTPLISWALNNLIPAQIDLITAAIQFIDEIIQAAEPALLWFWDTFLVPIRDYIWQSIIDFINLMTDAFNALTDWAKNNQSTVENIATVVLGFLAGIWIYNSTKKLIEFCTNLGNAFVTLGNKMAEGGLKGAFFAASVGILAAGIITLAKQWDKMTPAERAITILGGLAAAATAAAIAIGVFHTAWSVGVAAAAIAGGLALLGLSFAFSDTGDTGDAAKQAADNFYSSYDWNKNFSLPALATGAVLPPNKPFMAIVGDQKHGTNIEAPLQTIVDAMNIALAQNGGNNNGDIVIKFEGNLAQLGRVLNPVIERQKRRAGTSFSGAY